MYKTTSVPRKRDAYLFDAAAGVLARSSRGRRNAVGRDMGKKPKSSLVAEDEDLLLAAAVARAAEERAVPRSTQPERSTNTKAKAKPSWSAPQAAVQVPQLSIQELVAKLDVVPTFAIMNHHTSSGAKRFMPMTFSDSDGTQSPEPVCAFFIDPDEAQRSLVQAQQACADLNLVLGAMPLGHAFALVVGWADAEGDHPFVVRGSAALTKDMRSHLVQQLDKAGLPSYWQIPVILCEELQSPTVLPAFFTHEGLTLTWRAVGKPGPPPRALQVLDLRLLVRTMLAPFSQTGTDWSIARFVGCERASQVVQRGLDELAAAGGIGSGKGSGDAAALQMESALDAAAQQVAEALEKAVIAKADPESEPPPLLDDLPPEPPPLAPDVS